MGRVYGEQLGLVQRCVVNALITPGTINEGSDSTITSSIFLSFLEGLEIRIIMNGKN